MSEGSKTDTGEYNYTHLEDRWNSVRRYYVDEFFEKKIHLCKNKDRILDLGGKKINKRGTFNIDQFGFNVVYANFDLNTSPDICLDAHTLPFISNSYDCVICSELVEHIKHPSALFNEVNRVLKPKGIMLITAPFMYPVHADPFDYRRFTDHYFNEILSDIGFAEIVTEPQGGYWSVFVDMIRGWSMEKEEELTGIQEKLMNWVNVNIQPWMKKRALIADRNKKTKDFYFMKGCTTGFGVVCRKK